MGLFSRKATPAPERPTKAGPSKPDAWLITLRSVPRHYQGIKTAIESAGEAQVYFGEALAYIKGQGVSLFRVEATGLNWVDALYDWWRRIERQEAFTFDINLYFHNTQWVANLREHSPEDVKNMIRGSAPTFHPQPDR
jgi:hypothetical protein